MNLAVAILYTVLTVTFTVEAIFISPYYAVAAALWAVATTLAWITYTERGNR